MSIIKGLMVTIMAAAFLFNTYFITNTIAQEEKPKQKTTQEEKARGEHELGTMTVTAQKQEENVQEVPISITVMNELDIEDRKIESVMDIADFVPNLMFFTHGYSGMNAPSMRGMTAPAEAFTVSAGLYIDGIPETSAVGLEETMLDIERIEVLRGPQGTIYGKGAEVGAINIITRQPDNEFRGKISVQGGEDEKGQFALNLSGPIQEDKLFFGLSGLYYTKDGFIENTTTGDMIDDKEHWYGRGRIRWTPTYKLDISLAASRLEYDEGEPSKTLGEAGTQMFWLPPPQDRQVSSNFDGWDKSSRDNQSLKIAYDLSDSTTLSSITTHKKYHQHYATDTDASSMTLMHNVMDSKYDTITQEFRLNYSSGRLKGLVGLYYDQDEFDIYYDVDYGAMVANTNRKFEGETYAVFTNHTYSLTTQLNLVAGLRYETEKKDFTDNNIHLNMDDSWDQLSPKAALEYSLTPEFMTYISASHGYRSGGFNTTAVSNPQNYIYDSETLWSYEIGAKIAFWDNKLIVNSAVYYMDIKDMQVNEQTSPTETYLTNAATATGVGAELEVTAQVLDGLSINASFGYNKTEFDDFQTS